MKFSKIFPLFLIILIGLTLLASFALAQKLEIEYPQVGPAVPAELKELPQYIRYVFMFAIIIAGLVAFGSLVYGGFRYLASAGNPAAMSDARSQMTAGILGLILLLTSFLILQTINPRLIILKIGEVSARMGIILCKAATCSPDILQDPDARSGQDYLVVKSNRSCLEPCEPGDLGFYVGSIYFFESSDEVIVELYREKNYKPKPPDWTSADKDIPAGTSVNVGKAAKSILLIWKTPGVYLFSTTNCDDPTAEVQYFGPPGSQSFTHIDFNDKARAIKIIPRTELVWDAAACPIFPPAVADCQAAPGCCKSKVIEKFGAVLFEDENYRKSATVWLGGEPDDPKAQCLPLDVPCSFAQRQEPYCIENISTKASSIYVFRQTLEKPANLSDWGEGVTIFEHSEWNDQESGAYCGPINIGLPEVAGWPKPKPIWVDGSKDLGGGHPEYGTLDCQKVLGSGGIAPIAGEVSSIKVAGNYLGVLFRVDGRGEVFAPIGSYNLKTNYIGNDAARFLLVIPGTP